MSTRIYNGYRIKNINIENFKSKYLELKIKIENIAKNNINKHISDLYYQNLDEPYNKSPKNVLSELNGNLNFEIEQLTNGYRSIYLDKDIGFYVKEYKNDLYLYMFYEDNELKKYLLDNMKNIEDYSYWDNSDKPQNVSDSHWKKREKNWSILINKYSFEKSNFETIEFFKSLSYLENFEFKYENLIQQTIKERSEQYSFDRTIVIIDSKENSLTGNINDYKHSIYLKCRNKVKDGQYDNLKNNIKKYFLNIAYDVTKKNFYKNNSIENYKEV
jgi:hypothetical protein